MDNTYKLRLLAVRGLLRVEGMDVNVLRYVALGLADNLILGYGMDKGLTGIDFAELHWLIETQLTDVDLSDSDAKLRSFLDAAVSDINEVDL